MLTIKQRMAQAETLKAAREDMRSQGIVNNAASKLFGTIKQTLKGHGDTVARSNAALERATNAIDAQNVASTLSAALNKSVRIASYLKPYSTTAMLDSELSAIVQRATRHDPRKARDLEVSCKSGVLTGSECSNVLPFILKNNNDGRIERSALESAGLYQNNRKTFCIMLQKAGLLEPVYSGRSIVHYNMRPSFVWTRLDAIVNG
jgi:hypothetical protein